MCQHKIYIPKSLNPLSPQRCFWPWCRPRCFSPSSATLPGTTTSPSATPTVSISCPRKCPLNAQDMSCPHKCRSQDMSCPHKAGPTARYELSFQVSVLRYELSLRVWISGYELSPRVSVSRYELLSQVSVSRYELSPQVLVSTQCCRSVRVRDAGDAGPGQDGPPQELQHQDLRRPLAHIALHHQRRVTQLLLNFLNFVINIFF